MLDGRFSNLEDVIEHYSSDMQNHPRKLLFMQDSEGNVIKYNLLIKKNQHL